ncbi:hypothetical protein V8E51_011865 [Hyaloscypha variabilis]
MTLQHYVSHAFNQDDPAVLACAISFIILSMQCQRMNLDQSELPIPAAELVDRYVSNIDRHVTIIRRGLFHSMLLGMHRCIVLPHAQSPYLKRQESVWWHLLEYGAVNTSEAMSGSIFRFDLSIIVSAISQMSPEISPLSLPKTIEIDNQLRDLAHNMPPCWWDLVAYLHLPFIVEHIDNHSYEQNHEKCLQASREIMKIYIMLREVLGATIHICRIIDFQTFTAAVILILGLLSRKHNITVDHSGQDKSDWNLIHQVVDAFRQVSVEDNNLTAVQCLQSLEKLDGKSAREPPVGSATEESLQIDIFNTPFLHRIVENCNMITQHPSSNQFPCHDVMATDIDQDSSWMLNEQYHSHS